MLTPKSLPLLIDHVWFECSDIHELAFVCRLWTDLPGTSGHAQLQKGIAVISAQCDVIFQARTYETTEGPYVLMNGWLKPDTIWTFTNDSPAKKIVLRTNKDRMDVPFTWSLPMQQKLRDAFADGGMKACLDAFPQCTYASIGNTLRRYGIITKKLPPIVPQDRRSTLDEGIG